MKTCHPLLSVAFATVVAAAAQQPSLSTGFDRAPAGELRSVETDAGRWTAEAGHAVIDAAHHRSGHQCLHIVGGKQRRVVFEPKAGESLSELRFWAERWTRRAPFEFRVEQRRGGRWREIYRGDEQVVIGSFKTQVRVPLTGAPGKLRFTCTSPAGVLIDDVRLGRAAPMRVVSTTVTQPVVPVLLGNEANTVANVLVEAEGGLQPLAVTAVHVNLDGTTDLADIEVVELRDADGARIGEAMAPAKRLVFGGKHVLREGRNQLRVSVRLREGADIDHVVDAGCDAVVLADGTRLVPDVPNPDGAQRCGVAVRRRGDDGSKGYRIPGIVTTKAGTLVAVYDARWRGMGDLPGDIDVAMSRSVDGGRTWQPMRIIMDMGKDPAFRFDGIGDPSILYDPVGDTIWVAATWSHGNRSWRGSGPGLAPEETGQLMLSRSVDDGRTWSKPINITRQIKRPEWCFVLQGPGRGICTSDGTLVFPAQYQDTPEKRRMPHSTILYSKDRGKTWHIGTGAKPNTTEAQVAEVGDGVLMLNMRDNRGGARAIYTTRDLGATWTEHATSRKALVEPVCNAALLRAGERTLLFVNPAVRDRPRRHMTIKLSPDLGETWPEDRQLLIDAGASAGYPSATMIDDAHVGVFFEGSNALLTFLRIPIADIRR